MLSHPRELLDAVDHLYEVVSELGTVSALGYVDRSARRVAEALDLIQQDGRWKYLDLRTLNPEQAYELLSRHLEDPAVVLVSPGSDDRSMPIRRLVKAAIDRRSQVELLPGTRPQQRKSDQALILLLEGCGQIDQVDEPLREIPYFSFRGGSR